MSTGNRTSQRRHRSHDREAFRAETLALFGSVYRVARRLTRSPADAEDLTQETYARALGAYGGFQVGVNLKSPQRRTRPPSPLEPTKHVAQLGTPNGYDLVVSLTGRA